MSEECDSCGNTLSEPDFTSVSIGDDAWELCPTCTSRVRDGVDIWSDKLTKEHYDKAADYLRSLDEIWCVKADAYQGGEIWVHTPYCSADVVLDVTENLGFKIRHFSLISDQSNVNFDCIKEHGACIEINLVYDSWSPSPAPVGYELGETYSNISWLEEFTNIHDDSN